MRRLWQLLLTRLLYWRVRLREQEGVVTHGLLLEMSRILDDDQKAQTLYLAAGRRGEKEEMAYYDGQRKLIDWITHGEGTESCPTRPRNDDPGEYGHSLGGD